jgi:asparagine synthase (glutamine-hydrolysing)
MQYNVDEILLVQSKKGIRLPGLHTISDHLHCNQLPFEYQGLKIVFTGYLFNFNDLNKDTFNRVEQLIADYYLENRTSEITRAFDGYFSAVIIEQEKVTILMDKYGIETGYFVYDEKKPEFIFSTSLPLVNKFRGLTLDINSMASYLLITDLPSDETMFDGVKKCRRGEQLVYQNSTLHSIAFDFVAQLTSRPEANTDKPIKIILQELDELLYEIIDNKISKMKDVPVCNLLSGGVDSSLIQAYLLKSESSNRSLCANIQGFGKEDEYSTDVAQILNSDHNVVQQDINDVISGMNSGIEQLMVPWIHIGEGMIYNSLESGSNYTGSEVFFSGNGSDTLFGHGKAIRVANFCKNHPVISRWLFSLLARIDNKWKFAELISKTEDSVSVELGNNLFVNKKAIQLFGESRMNSIISRKCKSVNAYPGDFINKLYFAKIFDGEITWENSVLYKLAKKEHHYVVFPFIDERLVQYVINIPFKKKLHRNRAKYLPKKLLEQYLPKKLVYRKKVSKNTPWNQIFHNENRKEIASFYLENYGQILNHGFLNHQFGRPGFEAESLKLRNIYQLSQFLNSETSGLS